MHSSEDTTTANPIDATLLGLPTTEIATAAHALIAKVAPDVVYHHSMRSYLFARKLAAAQGLHTSEDYDDELVYLSCLLHDLGATDHANGDQRFEVDGADAAMEFLRGHDMDETRARSVWNAIALHTSDGLAPRFGTVAAAAQMGIGADILGRGRELLPPGYADEVHALLPRHDLGYVFADMIAQQVHANPTKGGPFTLAGHLHRLRYPAATVTWFDLVELAGWGDKPIPSAAHDGSSGPQN